MKVCETTRAPGYKYKREPSRFPLVEALNGRTLTEFLPSPTRPDSRP